MANILNILSTIKKDLLKDFIFETYYRRVGFPKENSYYSKEKHLLLFASKLIDKIPDASNANEYYKSYLKRKKNATLVKRSKISTQ